MEDIFYLKNNVDVVIYGAGELGRNIYEKISHKYNVVAMVDRNSRNLSGFKVPILQPDENSLKNVSRKTVVIVCVHNGAWHNEIAKKMAQIGFEQILFLPFFSDFDEEEEYHMKLAYNLFEEEEYAILENFPIPKFSAIKSNKELDFVRIGEHFVVAWLSVDILYSYRESLEHEKNKMHEYYEDIPMCLFEPYIELFKYIDCGQGNFDLYFDFIKKSVRGMEKIEKSKLLKDRVEVFRMLETEIFKGRKCMETSPIDVVWNEKGYFNVTDGHHRVAFNILKKNYMVPARMSVTDFDKWRKSIFYKWDLTLMYDVDNVEKLMLFQSYLGLRDWKMYSFIDITSNNGYFARNFQRMGIHNVKIIENDLFDEKQFEIPKDKYAIACVCNRLNVDGLKRIIPLFENNNIRLMLWESKENADIEKEYLINHTKYNEYHRLAISCRSGSEKEIGVYKMVE